MSCWGMRLRFSTLLLLVATLLASRPASAQATETEALDDTDPLGMGDLASLEQVPIEPAPRLRPPAPRQGEVLGAAPTVREVEHRTHVSWRALEATAEELWRFGNTGSFPAELRYRQALPPGARVERLSVCEAARCRDASVSGEQAVTLYAEARAREAGSEDAPIGLATITDDARGHAVVVRAAAVPAAGELTIHLTWSVDAPIVGGLMRLTLPARGTDPRAAPAWITAEAAGLAQAIVEGGPGDRPAQVEPWFAAQIEALADGPSRGAVARSQPCDRGRCLTIHAWGPPATTGARDVLLLLDVSPSVSWPRMRAALASVLSGAPGGSRFLLVAFAARAELLTSEWRSPDEIPMTTLSAARAGGLGPATRLDEALRVARPFLRGSGHLPSVVLISDGLWTDAAGTRRAFEDLEAHHASVSLLDLGDDDGPGLAGSIEGAGGRVIRVGDAAEAAHRGRRTSELDRRVRGLFAARVGLLRGRVGSVEETLTLYAGDSTTLRVAGHGAVSARLGDHRLRVETGTEAETAVSAMLAAVADDAGGEPSWTFLALAPPEPVPPPASPTLGRGVPAETVLSMLRTRLIPPARACFRRDRAGREDYALRAGFRFRMQNREVVEASISGELPDSLRRCLLDTLFGLEVPSFRGAVIVTYPLRTVPVNGPSMTIELLPEVAQDVDRVVGEAPSPDLP